MTDNTQEKNYVGSLVRISFSDGNGDADFLYTVYEQNNDKLTLRRTDTGKEMVVPIRYVLSNKHFHIM